MSDNFVFRFYPLDVIVEARRSESFCSFIPRTPVRSVIEKIIPSSEINTCDILVHGSNGELAKGRIIVWRHMCDISYQYQYDYFITKIYYLNLNNPDERNIFTAENITKYWYVRYEDLKKCFHD